MKQKIVGTGRITDKFWFDVFNPSVRDGKGNKLAQVISWISGNENFLGPSESVILYCDRKGG